MKFAVILVSVAIGVGETLHRSQMNFLHFIRFQDRIDVLVAWIDVSGLTKLVS